MGKKKKKHHKKSKDGKIRRGFVTLKVGYRGKASRQEPCLHLRVEGM